LVQRDQQPVRELDALLEGVAERIVLNGATTEASALQAVADAARWAAPGAAAALVDWEATEILRLRAFGVLHSVVVEVLGDEDRWWLLDRLRNGDHPHAGLVA
jgi:hypothetical protein